MLCREQHTLLIADAKDHTVPTVVAVITSGTPACKQLPA